MKIVVTGLGAISAAGANVDETFETLETGKRNAGPVSLFPTDLTVPVFEVPELPFQHFPDQMRTLNLCLCAVEEAIDHSGLRDSLKGLRVGVSLGTTIGSLLNDVDFYRKFRALGTAPIEAVDRYLQGNLSSAVSSYLGVRGPSLTVVNACASGADAVGVAVSWMRAGLCDVAIAGGADEMSLIPLCGFNSLGILSESLCAPFDRDRKGLNLGEGAGIFILETEERAHKRGKKAVFSVSGYGSANDAYHLTAPSPDGVGLEKSIAMALSDADIEPTDVGFVNAHGTATRENDRVEGSVLSKAFAKEVPFCSTKGITGHTLGAAGGLEAVLTAMCLEKGWIPASVGFENQDADIPVTPTTEKTMTNSRYAISTSLGFGGNNTTLVLEHMNGSGS